MKKQLLILAVTLFASSLFAQPLRVDNNGALHVGNSINTISSGVVSSTPAPVVVDGWFGTSTSAINVNTNYVIGSGGIVPILLFGNDSNNNYDGQPVGFYWDDANVEYVFAKDSNLVDYETIRASFSTFGHVIMIDDGGMHIGGGGILNQGSGELQFSGSGGTVIGGGSSSGGDSLNSTRGAYNTVTGGAHKCIVDGWGTSASANETYAISSGHSVTFDNPVANSWAARFENGFRFVTSPNGSTLYTSGITNGIFYSPWLSGDGSGVSNVVAKYVSGSLTNSITGNAATATTANSVTGIIANSSLTNLPAIRQNLIALTPLLSSTNITFLTAMPNTNYYIVAAAQNGVFTPTSYSSKTTNGFTANFTSGITLSVLFEAVEYKSQLP